jgi:phosphoribosylformimino-5-aminoimidazole carboxamide ribotide isomerase
MRLIGVLDVRDGVAVYARGGVRERYEAIGDPLDLARNYVDDCGVAELYVADLDAIENPAHVLGHPHVRTICERAAVWLDAGVSSVIRAREALALGAAHVVVGLETLPSFDVLSAICEAVGSDRVAFSLDMRDGRPLGIGENEDPAVLASHAVGCGASAVIVLDLARVGMRAGLDVDLLMHMRHATRGVELIAGGGVRGERDLDRLADIGVDGALVATALLDGTLKRSRFVRSVRL